jgi:hypothetical protein
MWQGCTQIPVRVCRGRGVFIEGDGKGRPYGRGDVHSVSAHETTFDAINSASKKELTKKIAKKSSPLVFIKKSSTFAHRILK